LLVSIDQASYGTHARIADENVELTEIVRRSCDHPDHFIALCDVDLHGDRPATARSDLIRYCFDRVRIQIADAHSRAFFSKQLGLELSDYGILVNCLCPGIVDTPMWDLIDRETAKLEGVPAGSVKAQAVASIPLGHIQKPEDVANVVAFLASDDASYITADTVNCAGGLLPLTSPINQRYYIFPGHVADLP